MKNTGITRKVDDMGRIVLPIELRRNLNIEEGTALEIYVDESGNIVLRPMDRPLTEDELLNRIGKPVYVVADIGSCDTSGWDIVKGIQHHVLKGAADSYVLGRCKVYEKGPSL